MRGLGSLRGSDDNSTQAAYSSNTSNHGFGTRRAYHGFSGTHYGSGGTSGTTTHMPKPPGGGVSSTSMILGAPRRHQTGSNQPQPPASGAPAETTTSNQQTHGGTTVLNPTGNPRHGRVGYGLDLAALLANLEVQDSSTATPGSVTGKGGATASNVAPPVQQHANTARKFQRKGSASSGSLSARNRVQSGKNRSTIALHELPAGTLSGSSKVSVSNSTGSNLTLSGSNKPTTTASSGLLPPTSIGTQPSPRTHQMVVPTNEGDVPSIGSGSKSSSKRLQSAQYDRPNSLYKKNGNATTTTTAPTAKPTASSNAPLDSGRGSGSNLRTSSAGLSSAASPTSPVRNSPSAVDTKTLIDQDGKHGCMAPLQAVEMYEPLLSRYERKEILDYEEIYFLGAGATKIQAPVPNAANYGFDDERGDYVVTMKDHIAYRYEVVAELGKGSFGQVLRVKDHKKNTQCALKIIRNKKRFHQQAAVEIRILDHLRSRDPDDRSCTVRMLNYFKFRSHTIITFEMHSMNLYELTKLNKYQPFAPALIKRFTAQILVAMSFMWREHIVHCDMKPENILLKYENKTSIKIIDFGSSCFETERIYTYIQSRFYRAPEIILGLSYGRPIDTWSLGCIICEMQIGYPIFPGENEKEQLLCIMEVLGVPPQRMVDRSPRKKEFFDSSGSPKLFANSRNKVRKPATKDIFKALRTEDSSFVDFILCFLQWEPSERISPTEAMRHPWVAECFQQDTIDPPSSSSSSRPQRQGSAAPNSARGVPSSSTGASSSGPNTARGTKSGTFGGSVLPPTSGYTRASGGGGSNLPTIGDSSSGTRGGSARKKGQRLSGLTSDIGL